MQKGIFVILIIIAFLLALNLFTHRYIGITAGAATPYRGCYILNTWTGKVWGVYISDVDKDNMKPVIKE